MNHNPVDPQPLPRVTHAPTDNDSMEFWITWIGVAWRQSIKSIIENLLIPNAAPRESSTVPSPVTACRTSKPLQHQNCDGVTP
jgi:hypothetical protein